MHVPGTKETDLLTIYRYPPFQIPIPIFPKAHDLTIAQSLANQQFSQSALDQILYQNALDYPQ
jgi:hypothetical protein